MRGQLPAGQRDDNRIVATQQNVDHDDLSDSKPEIGGEEFFHGERLGWGVIEARRAKPDFPAKIRLSSLR
ncbi:MAG: hypothetical protein NT071_13020 [Burkholderiales bacterium]|nr:hypothetical protein [Burkholderiales bacterium]